jgi:hypothetical protein
MLSILSNSFLTATRNARWDAPPNWTHDGRPQKTFEIEQKEAELRALSRRSRKS